MIELLSIGKSDFENVNEFHTDEEFYKNALGTAYGIPSESSLRNRLDGIDVSMNQQNLDGNIDMFQSCKFEPSALKNGCVPVDIDVSPFDNSGSHKAGVSRTYKNFDGYAPILPISERKDICATQSFGKADSIVSPVRRNFCLKRLQRQSR